MPDDQLNLPFGLRNSSVTSSSLKLSFKKELVLLLGELDNENETGGLMLTSPTVDKQGIGRLARGKSFYQQAKSKAAELNTVFNWKLIVVPHVGHDFRKIAPAAAAYLYDGSQ